MAFRNPPYLNLPLLQNLADYYAIELPGEAQVTRRSLAERKGMAGIKTGVELGG
jgi:hypothetical protein